MKAGLMLGVNPNSKREEHDFYATNPSTLHLFLNKLKEDNIKLNNHVWECACGKGHLSEVLIKNGYNVYSTDLIDRGYGEVCDFLKCDKSFNGDILTNPPFKYAEEFIAKGMSLINHGNKLIFLLKIQFLESKKRLELFKKYNLKYLYVHSTRQKCSMNGDFDNYPSSTQFYAWYIFEKGYKGDTILRWI